MFVHRAAPLLRLAVMIDRHQAALACAIAFVFLMALHQGYGFSGFHYDSAQYWSLATFESLSTLPSSRGYIFPTLLLPLKYLSPLAASPTTTFRVGASIVYGILLTTALPAAFQQAFGGKITLLRRLVPVALLAMLFPGVLLYPLSDLPAVLLAFTALMCALRGMEASASRSRFAWLLFAAGLLMGAAYNTRTIYLFAGLPLGLLVLVTIRGPWAKAPFPRWLGLAAFAAGVVLVSLPQLAINKRTHGVNSLAVQAVVNKRSLFASQMVWGMTLQRYETTLNGSSSAVYYTDPAGEQLFHEVAGNGDLFSLPYYLKVMAQHPLEFIALYTRHLVNGLDVRDGLVYTHKPSPLRTRTALLNFMVLALAAAVATSLVHAKGAAAGSGFQAVPVSWPMALAVLLLPVAAIVPGAIETRFFLPVHLLAYTMIALHFDATRMARSFTAHGRAIVATLLVGAGIFFAVSFNTMANLQYDWPEIYRHGPR